jgi:precorrin-6B methylase 2
MTRNPDSDALLTLGRALQRAAYRFTTVTPSTHRRLNGRPRNECAVDLRGVFGWSRPFRPSLLEPDILAAMRAAGVVADEGELLRSKVRASTVGDLLVFHSAFPTDDDDAVFFGPDTYRFVGAMERTLAQLERAPLRAVEIGCGAAPGAIVLARRFPNAEVWAADINERALALAAVNAQLAGTPQVRLCRSDLFDDLDGKYDVVLSNPPFILDPDERTYRHGGGELGIGLSIRIVETALARLQPGGRLLLYTGVAMTGADDPFLAAIAPRLQADCSHWSYEELDPDIFGGQLGEPGYEQVERIAAVWLHAVRLGDGGA